MGTVLLVEVFIFPSRALSVSSYLVMAGKVSAEKCADSLIRVPFYMTNGFTLTVLKIFFLSLTFVNLVILCLL